MYKKLICFCFILTLFLNVKIIAQDGQDLTPPPSAFNSVYEAMNGNWVAQSKMMGAVMNMDLKAYWDINHQFLVIDLRSTGVDDATKTYQGKGLFGLDEKGNAKTWWFDSWGAGHVSTGTGTFSENRLTITGGTLMSTETRTFQVNGNEMVMNGKGTMTIDGNTIPYDETIIFRK